MNQELDDECSLQEPPPIPMPRIANNTFAADGSVTIDVPESVPMVISANPYSEQEDEVEYRTGREKVVLYPVLLVVCVMCLWGAWTFAKAVWHGFVWLVTQ